MIPAEIDIHPAAITEVRKAYSWYRRRSARAASRFQAAFEAALQQIAESPGQWPAYLHGTRYRGIVLSGDLDSWWFIDSGQAMCRL
jgi:plasmid stabilization system protein ParE